MRNAQRTTVTTTTAAIDRPDEREMAMGRIQTTYERFGRAWSAGSADLLATLLADECDHVTLTAAGQVRHGRDELVDRWRQAFGRRPPGFSIRLRPVLTSIRLLGERLALVDGDLDYSGGIGAEGTLRGRRTQRFAAIMTRTADDWLFLSMRVGAAAAQAASTAFAPAG